jgi:hypothetical protein
VCFQRHDSKIYKIVPDDKRVEEYILPKNIPSRPSFKASKQLKAHCTEIYFKRIADSNFDATVELLRKRDKVTRRHRKEHGGERPM